MKTGYTSPEISISEFCIGNIITASGSVDGINLTQQAMNDNNITEIEKTSLELFSME